MNELELGKHIWIARQPHKYHDRLELFNAKPLRKGEFWDTYTGFMELDPFWFEDLKWEDEPREVILVKNTDKLVNENFVWIARDDMNGDNLCIFREYPDYNFDTGAFENRHNTGFLYINENDYQEVKRGAAPMQYIIKYKDSTNAVATNDLSKEDRNEIIWRIRKETGLGLATIDKALDRFIDALKKKPNVMDVTYELNFEWKPRDMRRQLHFKDCCKSCVYNLYGMPPCQKMNEPQVIEFLERETEENECCPEWYDEC